MGRSRRRWAGSGTTWDGAAARRVAARAADGPRHGRSTSSPASPDRYAGLTGPARKDGDSLARRRRLAPPQRAIALPGRNVARSAVTRLRGRRRLRVTVERSHAPRARRASPEPVPRAPGSTGDLGGSFAPGTPRRGWSFRVMHDVQPSRMRALLDQLLAARARRDREPRFSDSWQAADADLHSLERAIFELPRAAAATSATPRSPRLRSMRTRPQPPASARLRRPTLAPPRGRLSAGPVGRSH